MWRLSHYTHTCTFTCVYMYMYMYMYVQLYMYMYSVHGHVSVMCASACLLVCLSVCLLHVHVIYYMYSIYSTLYMYICMIVQIFMYRCTILVHVLSFLLCGTLP